MRVSTFLFSILGAGAVAHAQYDLYARNDDLSQGLQARGAEAIAEADAHMEQLVTRDVEDIYARDPEKHDILARDLDFIEARGLDISEAQQYLRARELHPLSKRVSAISSYSSLLSEH